MSAATDEVPVFVLPEQLEHRSRRAALRVVSGLGAADECDGWDVPGRYEAGEVVRLHRPAPRSVAAPVRLTRRGVVVLAAGVGLLAAVVVALAWLSAPPSAGSAPVSSVTGNSIAVAPGDSLWSIAGRVAPNRDPRAEVALLQRLNHLDGSSLVPGQVLRIH